MGNVIGREPCPSCRAAGNDAAGDNLNRYEDGGAYCFRCNYFEGAGGGTMPSQTDGGEGDVDFASWSHRKGQVRAIEERGISQATARAYGVKIGRKGEIIYPYYRDGRIIAQHCRFAQDGGGKKVIWDKPDGLDVKKLPLFGQHLFKSGKKKLVITEGECDALSIAQLDGCKWPVVSLPGGTESAVHAIKANYEWVAGFEEIILCFDMDDPGRKAVQKVAEILPIGKVSVSELPAPYKDANEMLLAGKAKELKTAAVWEAKPWRPDGVVDAFTVDLNLDEDLPIGWPFKELTVATLGRRGGELCIITSGTGMGKSTFTRQCALYDLAAGRKVGMLMLEESASDTITELAGMHARRPFRRLRSLQHLIRMGEVEEPEGFVPVTNEEVMEARSQLLGPDKLYVDAHFGSIESDRLLSKVRYMAAIGCEVIYLDHISIAISGNSTDNERQDIDRIMTALRSIVEETGVWLAVISHLRSTDGRTPHEEGGRVTIQHLRGSRSLGHLADSVVALERNQQAPDESQRDCILVRVLKDRLAGSVGPAAGLTYDRGSGLLEPIEWELDDDGTPWFGGSPETFDGGDTADEDAPWGG